MNAYFEANIFITEVAAGQIKDADEIPLEQGRSAEWNLFAINTNVDLYYVTKILSLNQQSGLKYQRSAVGELPGFTVEVILDLNQTMVLRAINNTLFDLDLKIHRMSVL